MKLPKQSSKITALASLGGMLEFFEFTIYALFSQYLSAHFFPANDQLSSLIKTFAVYAIGYLARPLGGLIFGSFGDRYGRRSAFSITVFLMSVATLLIGCLPDYQTIGMAAPILLILLRILQGLSVGGEIPGATIFTAEHASPHRRGRAIGIVFMSITLGNVLGGATGFLLTHFLGETVMAAWGWRLPFFFGFALGIISYWLRKNTAETPVFQSLEKNQIYAAPVLQVLKTALPKVITGVGLTALTSVTMGFFLYLPVYSSVVLHQAVSYGYLLNSINFTVLALVTALSGYLSEIIERKRLIIFGCLLVIGYIGFHVFLDLNIVAFSLVLAVIVGIVNGCYALTILGLYPANLRYSGVAISYCFGVGLFAGLSPLAFTYLIKALNNLGAPYYVILMGALITLISVIFTFRHSFEMDSQISVLNSDRQPFTKYFYEAS